MNDLFTPEANLSNTPLAALLRPRSLDEFVGQEHILGSETPLAIMIAKDELTSLILYGPPGCG